MGFEPYISRILHRVTPFIGLRGSLAADQTARMLHVLLVTLAVWLAAAWVSTIPFAPVSFPRIFNPLVVEASYAAALVLLRLGHFRRASLAYLAGTWIWATLVSSFFGGVHSPGALLYVSLPASAAWLLGYNAAIRTAGGCLLGALVFTALEMAHVSLPVERIATPLGTWFIIVQAVLINAIPVGQIIGRLRETLKELQQNQQHLESLVDQRTHEQERLRASQQQLQTLAGNLLTAQEDERRRLSRELHDEVTQVLAALSIELGRLATEIPNTLENTRARIQAMQDRTNQLSSEVRRLAHGLHPSVIEDLGLSIALKEFCHQLGMAKAINVYYEGLVEDQSLDKTAATCLYRVAQESLRNSTIHGHATEVHVELAAEATSIHLRVRDNGTGFSIEDARAKAGLGLISMQERIRFVGGMLTVSSQPGKGTEISASVPVAGVGYASRANSAG